MRRYLSHIIVHYFLVPVVVIAILPTLAGFTDTGIDDYIAMYFLAAFAIALDDLRFWAQDKFITPDSDRNST